MRRGFCTLSRPLAAMPQLPAVLGAPLRYGLDPRAEGLVVWGDHLPSRRASWLGRLVGLPLVRVEDGFIRSVGLGKAGTAPVSMVVDRRGFYFDARRPSDLEVLIGQGADAALAARAEALAQTIAAQDIDKYNLPRVSAPGMAERYGAVLVDQVAGDRSIAGSGGSQADFDRMFADAMTAFGPRGFFVKAHPDVVAGFARGHLDEHARREGILRVAENLGPAALLARCDALWTLSSTLGFEALLRGQGVVTYGMPFYAGWGLTEDRARGPLAGRARARRLARPSRFDLAARALISYARYADPVSGAALEPEEAIDWVLARRQALPG